MNVPFQMIDSDQRDVLRKGQCLRIGDTHQQRSRQARSARDGDRIQIREAAFGLGQRGSRDGNDIAQMFAAGQFRHDAAIRRVHGNLRSHDRRARETAALYNCGCRLIA